MICISRPSITLAAILMIPQMLAMAGSATAMAQDNTLPGDADSLSETYKDWSVVCGALKPAASSDKSKQNRAPTSGQDGSLACVLSQQQVTEDRQRVLTVELRIDGNGLAGVMILPFGLALSKGVVLKADKAGPGDPIAFSTCLPAGCLVPLQLDAGMVAALRKGNTLSLLVSDRNGQPLEFAISLAGFAVAYDRVHSFNLLP